VGFLSRSPGEGEGGAGPSGRGDPATPPRPPSRGPRAPPREQGSVERVTLAEMDHMPSDALVGHLARACVRHPVALHVVFAATLERMWANDAGSAEALLLCLDEVWRVLSVQERGPLLDWAPFATTLAKRLNALVATHQLAQSHPLWRMAFEGVLMPCSALDSQVHEEAARIIVQLLDFGNPAEDFKPYIKQLLERGHEATLSEGPRGGDAGPSHLRATSARAQGGGGAAGSGSEDSDEADDGPTSAYRPRAPPAGTDGDAGEDRDGRGRQAGRDGVRSIYAMIARKLQLHGHGSMPELSSYLGETGRARPPGRPRAGSDHAPPGGAESDPEHDAAGDPGGGRGAGRRPASSH